ncbi:MAG: copper ion binding protein [FCB group bacterium]|nr:copper ion binding protein [FCB group bacterium]
MKTRKAITIIGMSLSLLAAFAWAGDGHGKMMGKNQQGMKMEGEGHAMIDLPSMQCDMCKNNIETGLSKIPGIKSVDVNVEKKTGHVNYDPAVIDESEIEVAINKLGYWANDKPADPNSYDNLMGCCQMPEEEYNQMMKSSKKMTMPHDNMMKKMMDRSGMQKMEHENMKMRNQDGMKMGSMKMDNMKMGDMKMGNMDMKMGDSSGKTSMTMISLPTVQCGSCQARIESNLSKIDGIVEVKVDIDRKMGHVVYDPEKLTVKSIENVIASIGYQANDIPADSKAYDNLPGCCKVP